MKSIRVLFAAALMLAPLTAMANCTTHTYIIDGKTVVCNTCCFGGNCTTTCF